MGPDVAGWAVGERATVGWFGGSCGHCRACRTGDVVHCPEREVPGLAYPGGWATTITAPATTLARIPDGLTPADASVFEAMRFAVTTGVRPMVETVPLEDAQHALKTQQEGKARFRMVLIPDA
ncbi:alcohol dehydrogenase catalytic domain-containing protein [Streptomyces sp. ST1020]|uniref:alcohol dehydrogenase catalytic domain-containing protein n=1 Tax=Streptomyces sp. ST1020 TaxID=1848901 RepID=UPI0034C656F9